MSTRIPIGLRARAAALLLACAWLVLGLRALPATATPAPSEWESSQSFEEDAQRLLALDPGPAVAADPALAPSEAVTSRSPRSAGRHAIVDPGLKAAFRDAQDPEVQLPIIVLLHTETADGSARAQLDASTVAERDAAFAQIAAPTMQVIANAVARGAATEPRALWTIEGIAAHADEATVLRLARRQDVRLILRDPLLILPETAHATDSSTTGMGPLRIDATDMGLQRIDQSRGRPAWNVAAIEADQVWELLGYDGTGVTVAVVDTGIDYHHPLLQSRYRGYREGLAPRNEENWWCRFGEDLFCGKDRIFPVDGGGHGSHVAGIVLGGDGIGVAPGAHWMSVQTCVGRVCPFTWLADGLQWLLALEEEDQPEIVNLSLGIDLPFEVLLLRPIINRLHGAGMFVVAATGNTRLLLQAPAMYTSTLGVGASTRDGSVYPQSARGLTQWGETKPDLVAPGVMVTSTFPGGGLGLLTGTSMAAPHVAGVAALLLDAAPDLTPEDLREILERTARPLVEAEDLPDEASGWGQVNAYAAVASVTDVGQLRGRVMRVSDSKPITWARVAVTNEFGDELSGVKVSTDDGSYKMDLHPGAYGMIVEAFGYASQVRRGDVIIKEGEETRIDPMLAVDHPMGTFSGRVEDAADGAPLAASIVLEGVPFDIRSDEVFGFSQQLPELTYNVRVERFGYRVIRDTVKVSAVQAVTRAYRLEEAPKILLVDGDAWAFNGATDYLRNALDELSYLYHEWRVVDERAGPGNPGGPPLSTTMEAYDLVIWSSPISSPNAVMGAWELLTYMERGGRLLLTGQDALCNDAGRDVVGKPCNENAQPHPYVRGKLQVAVVKDYADARNQVIGAVGGPLEGITLTLNGPDSMNNQLSTDSLSVADARHARLVATYPGGEGAGVLAETCVSHRAISLGFGFEGIAGAAMRRNVLARLISALEAPPPEMGLFSAADNETLVRSAGATASYTLTLYNTGSRPSAVDVSAEGAGWETELFESGFSAPLDAPVSLAPCQRQFIGVRVKVPDIAPHGASDRVTIRLRHDGGIEQTIGLHTRAPAPVLVVDEDYAENSEARYLSALEAAGVSYDVWEAGLFNLNPVMPNTDTLKAYPMVIWFTGANVLRPNRNFGLDAQRAVAGYLEAGGRLLLSSEDYLWHWGETPYDDDRFFYRDYLGVTGYVDNGGGVHRAALAGETDSIMQGIERCDMSPRPEEQDFSDRLIPLEVPSAKVVLRNRFGDPVAMQNSRQRGFRTVFLGFDGGLLNQACADELIGRAVDWFSPMGASALDQIDGSGQIIERGNYRGGDRIGLRLKLLHTGARPEADVAVRWTIPEGSQLVTSTLPNGWSFQAGALQWGGTLPRVEERELEIELILDDDLPERHPMTSVAYIASEGIDIQRATRWMVNAPDLGDSSKSVPDAARDVAFRERVKYVINVVNDGSLPAARFVVTDTLPAGLELVQGSWRAERGDVRAISGRSLVWETEGLPVDRGASLAYEARVVTRAGGWLKNRAELVVDGEERMVLEASVFARPQLLMPWLGRQIEVDP